MAMKKRFLPALMAGMVVVGSTGLVNAYAQTVTGNDTETLQSNVSVSGLVTDDKGIAQEGKLTVEVPTKMAFLVDQKGNFTGTKYTIKNNSRSNIDVFVSEFKKASGTIELVDEINAENSHRGQVKLTLTGDQARPVNLKTIESNPQDTLLAKINGSDSETIILGGEAGKNTNQKVDKDGASGEFNMVFKIKKSN